MEYKRQQQPQVQGKPRIIIHGGAGNITRGNMSRERYMAYRTSLLTILNKATTFLTTPYYNSSPINTPPTALEIATKTVTLLEDDPLFNSAHGAVFTRDGTNELEASVMVSRGYKKRGVGVTGLRHVRNPILLAKAILEAGEVDLSSSSSSPTDKKNPGIKVNDGDCEREGEREEELDVPSAQGHTLIHGPATEILARRYNLCLVDPSYFFTQNRWDEHIRALQREEKETGTATWSKSEYLPQGTCGAVVMDSTGALCTATSTGGMTNKLSGRVGDTPVPGAGFWAEEWVDDFITDAHTHAHTNTSSPLVQVVGALEGFLADCIPNLWTYSPIPTTSSQKEGTTTTRGFAASSTGNGDSFLRLCATHTVSCLSRFSSSSSQQAINLVAGPGGQLQQSAGDRWGRTGEGEGGMIGIEAVIKSDAEGNVVSVVGEVVQAHNCGGMFRAWVDDEGENVVRVFGNGVEEPEYGSD